MGQLILTPWIENGLIVGARVLMHNICHDELFGHNIRTKVLLKSNLKISAGWGALVKRPDFSEMLRAKLSLYPDQLDNKDSAH